MWMSYALNTHVPSPCMRWSSNSPLWQEHKNTNTLHRKPVPIDQSNGNTTSEKIRFRKLTHSRTPSLKTWRLLISSETAPKKTAEPSTGLETRTLSGTFFKASLSLIFKTPSLTNGLRAETKLRECLHGLGNFWWALEKSLLVFGLRNGEKFGLKWRGLRGEWIISLGNNCWDFFSREKKKKRK